ncbi:DUF3489 domain-containing protein [Candidatus Nitrotoga fabula]|uniref:DUF3489 domain-containing protein n=1 Tax=Candidatus Nitrotoga fabula TaxID=2182327 RepID=A0A916BAU3_9PROT|nr:DUF3489 domain-containing protein [Candidatus Nitrotoga fabula]CAE6686656.1 conserved hypothetical protein [Candidatus Nitrotoga fabula]
MDNQLTPAQHIILAYAVNHTDGKIGWFPQNINGGARKKVLDSLFQRALITPSGGDWFVAAEGYDAMGMPRPGNKEQLKPDTIAEIDQPEAAAPEQAQSKTSKRQNSKQAQVISMLRMPEGVTIPQICAATGWQQHSVRGMFSGVFKKKLGLTIVSVKTDAGDRAYRIG